MLDYTNARFVYCAWYAATIDGDDIASVLNLKGGSFS